MFHKRNKHASYEFCEACKGDHPAPYVVTFATGGTFVVCATAANEAMDVFGTTVRPITADD